MQDVFIHHTAIVESDSVGAGSRIWAYAHVLAGARMGKNCNIGDHCFVESGACIGDNVTVKNYVSLWEGVTLADDVFVGPMVCFTNDNQPRSPRMPEAQAHYEDKENWLARTVVEQGVSIGANATVLPGVRLGRYCVVGAGSVVTRNVEPHNVVLGTPARRVGYTCRCGQARSATADVQCTKCDTHLDATTITYQHAEN
jgi:acetyltransferase-like isoleucine patch superfamily enzyme